MALDHMLKLTAGSSQDMAGATTSGLLTSAWMDTSDADRALGDGNTLCATFTVGTAFASASANQTVSLQVVQLAPGSVTTTTGIGTRTFSTTVDPGNLVQVTGHGFVKGQRVTVTATGGLSASTNYFVTNVNTDNFRVALTPGGTPVTGLSAAGPGTLTFYPEPIGDSGFIPMQRLHAGARVFVYFNPWPDSEDFPYKPRIYGRIVPSTGTLTAGTVNVDVGIVSSTNKRRYPPVGYVVDY